MSEDLEQTGNSNISGSGGVLPSNRSVGEDRSSHVQPVLPVSRNFLPLLNIVPSVPFGINIPTLSIHSSTPTLTSPTFSYSTTFQSVLQSLPGGQSSQLFQQYTMQNISFQTGTLSPTADATASVQAPSLPDVQSRGEPEVVSPTPGTSSDITSSVDHTAEQVGHGSFGRKRKSDEHNLHHSPCHLFL